MNITILSVFIGGGIGASLRFLCTKLLVSPTLFSLPILACNTIGCFLIGLCLNHCPKPWHPAIVVGFLGSLTTFSSYVLDSVETMEKNQLMMGILTILLHHILGISCFYLGRSL